MFHSIMPFNDWNNQSYSTYQNLEPNDPSVESTSPWHIPQKTVYGNSNEPELFTNLDGYPGHDYVDLSLLLSLDDIDNGLNDLTPYQALSILTSPLEDKTDISATDSGMVNSWQICNSTVLNNNNEFRETSDDKRLKNNRKRSARRSPISSTTTECCTLESNHAAIPTAHTGSRPKRRRVQNTRQRKEANVRERNRMVKFNEAFDSLKSRVPTFDNEKRLSCLETLRLAVDYISIMKDILSDTKTLDNSLDVSSDVDDLGDV